LIKWILMMVHPQTLETAISAASSAHTDLHRAIYQLRHGSVEEAKRLLARQVAVLANVLMIL
jgi:hypothetical protein